jgi:hypothetical protein
MFLAAMALLWATSAAMPAYCSPAALPQSTAAAPDSDQAAPPAGNSQAPAATP